MPSVRIVVRTLIAFVLAVLGTCIAGPALAAQVTPAAQGHRHGQGSAETRRASSRGLSISIEEMSPRFARPGSTIVVKGTVTNHTGAPLSSVQVRLETSPTEFRSRSLMDEYAAGAGGLFSYNDIGQLWTAPATLHAKSTMAWSVSFPASSAGYGQFGVYPLVAQALSFYAPQDSARTFLPYWDPSPGAAPAKLSISWVWPLIDQPRQGPCRHTLSTSADELAASLAPGGRLDGLLAAGLRYAGSTHLTWAVDPALLWDATVMSQRYKVGGNETCTATNAMPASKDAAAWLSQLAAGTGADQMFVTPYADPDVSALSHSGLDADITNAYTLGNQVAANSLHRTFGQVAPGSGQSGTASKAIAWPEQGLADASVLTSLARDGQVGTVVLSSDLMRLKPTAAVQYPADDALARASTGIGTPMNVLLADSGITALAGSAAAGQSQGSQFSVAQEFLAQTAMITAEAPNSRRSLVVAPPSRWNPSAALASALLEETSTAPWLQPVSLATMAGGRHGSAERTSLPSVKSAPKELGKDYLATVRAARASAALYASLFSQPGPDVTQVLPASIAATESTAWRDKYSSGGWAALRNLSRYLSDRERQVKIISVNKVLLAGTSGKTPVSIFNGLPETVQVMVQAVVPPGSQLSIGDFDRLLTVQPQSTVTVSLPVRSAALGSTIMRLQLVTREGTPLPGNPQLFTVQATRFGRALLFLIAAALGVLVLTSLARWVRRGLKAGTDVPAAAAGGEGQDGTAQGDAPADNASGTDERSGVSR
jgi:hypothetical protein